MRKRKNFRLMPVSQLKPQLLSVISRVDKAGEECVVTRNGKPAAIILNYADWQGLKETMEVLSNKSEVRQIRDGIKSLRRGAKRKTLKETFGE